LSHDGRRVRQFASEHRLTDRPHSMLWLAKGYALPASMYAVKYGALGT